MKLTRFKFCETSLRKQQDRLKESISWFPYPALISLSLVLLCSGQIIPNLNPRLGNPADILPFNGEPNAEGSIWLSVSLIGKQIVITTDSREVMSWDASSRSLSAADPLIRFLKHRIKEITLAASLTKKASRSDSLVVLATDQSLKYVHLKSILYALASAGISEYAFETRVPF